jgi:hypothetical protein
MVEFCSCERLMKCGESDVVWCGWKCGYGVDGVREVVGVVVGDPVWGG